MGLYSFIVSLNFFLMVLTAQCGPNISHACGVMFTEILINRFGKIQLSAYHRLGSPEPIVDYYAYHMERSSTHPGCGGGARRGAALVAAPPPSLHYPDPIHLQREQTERNKNRSKRGQPKINHQITGGTTAANSDRRNPSRRRWIS